VRRARGRRVSPSGAFRGARLPGRIAFRRTLPGGGRPARAADAEVAARPVLSRV